MEEEIDKTKEIEDNIELLKSQLKLQMPNLLKAQKLDLLRYYLGEQEEESKKVKYNEETKDLDLSDSIRIGIYIISFINKIINDEEEKIQFELFNILKSEYYYVGRYLFEYYLPALEFGIPPEKQFLAPRVNILNKISKRLSVFYYKDRSILTISMPQGTGKTEISKRFMSWAIGKNPDLPNMMISYSAAIAKDKFFNGIDTIINDENGNYQRIFPDLRQVLKSADTLTLDYRNDNKFKPHSEYTLYCCGFDSSITGRTRAHNILYADDLVKDIEEASNKDIMDKKWIEFTGTIKKRMQGRCKMLIVGTIFSINDPLSKIIQYYEENDPDRIEIIKIPGLNQNGESNFNYKYGFAITTDMFNEDKAMMDPVAFSCLIQQEPIERKGLVFFEEDFKKFDLINYEISEGYKRTIATVDVAWGGSDNLSMPIVDEYNNGNLYLKDWYYNVATKNITIPDVVNRIIKYKISECYFEANNGGDMFADKVKEELEKRDYRDCYIWSKKSPTNISKKDRILANQDSIKGLDNAEYKLFIATRKDIKNNFMYNEALNNVFKFRQYDSKTKQKTQHDDAPDSLGMIFSQVLHCKKTYGIVKSNISRRFLGI